MHSLQFYQKPEITLVLTEEALKILMCPHSQNPGLESIPTILLKTHSTTEITWHGFCKLPHFKISENFLRGVTVISFIQEVATLLKTNCLEHIVHKANF